MLTMVIGIDGGGTKTKGVLADEKGRIYATATVGATNPNSVNSQDLKHHLHQLLQQLKQANEESFNQVKLCFAGMAGIGETNNENTLHQAFQEVCQYFKLNYQLHNDGLNALFAGTLGKPGIVQIAGTGSITYSLNDLGEFHRVGGWGYLFDDQGSGYDIGRQALTCVFQSYDGRGKPTKLTQLLLDHFKVDAVHELVSSVYAQNQPRSVIASICPLVSQAYESRDEVASRILIQASKQYALNIHTLIHRAFNDQPPRNVILSGGVFKRSDLLIPLIRDQLKYDIQLKKLLLEPVAGAVVAGLLDLGVATDERFEEQFTKGEVF